MNSRSTIQFAFLLIFLVSADAAAQPKTATINPDTVQPHRFIVRGSSLIDVAKNQPVFFRGMGYSPYLPGETPIRGAGPGDDNRYSIHFPLLRNMGVNYLHVFPMRMPDGFFKALDSTDMVYGQDIWIEPFTQDILDEKYQNDTLANIRQVIDHTYKVGRPNRLVLFSIGDELQAATVVRTNTLHPEVHEYKGKHLTVTGRTATEVALAKLIDKAIDYELQSYGQRHLYCHTSWTHIGPLANRPDLDIPWEHVLVPDMGDLICMNIYTYAHGVMSSPPGSVTGTNYQGYLEELAATSSKPILVTQMGFSTSPIMPKPEVIDYGGRKPNFIAEIFRSAWQDIRTAQHHERYAGLVLFEFQDEWWKIGWVPGDENQHEPEDPEEWFGIYEVGKDNRLTGKGNLPDVVRSLFMEQ